MRINLILREERIQGADRMVDRIGQGRDGEGNVFSRRIYVCAVKGVIVFC